MTQKLEIMIESHLRVLVEEIGERPGGSPADYRTARYIAETFTQAGLEVEEQRFDCPQWTHRSTLLTLNGKALAAAANAYSPACDVRALSVGVGTVAELENVELRGRLAILYGDLVPAPLSPKSWFLITEREEKIIHLLEEKEPAAVLTVQGHRGGLERLIEDWEFLIPSATIIPRTALTLLQSSKEAHLQIDSERVAGYSANIVARSPPRPYRVVICAHFDTKIDTPGALDNATGVSVLLALAQTFDAADFPFALEFVAFTNEEYLPIGDDEYLRRCEQNLSDVTTAINIDSVGQRLAANSIVTFSASAAFESMIKKLTPAFPGLVWVEPWPQSNHSTFAIRGVPSIAFSSTGRIELAHWPDDDLRWIDPSRVGDVARLIREIVTKLAENSAGWTREDPHA
jgi:aminopeptidase YwaD